MRRQFQCAVYPHGICGASHLLSAQMRPACRFVQARHRCGSRELTCLRRTISAVYPHFWCFTAIVLRRHYSVWAIFGCLTNCILYRLYTFLGASMICLVRRLLFTKESAPRIASQGKIPSRRDYHVEVKSEWNDCFTVA